MLLQIHRLPASLAGAVRQLVAREFLEVSARVLHSDDFRVVCHDEWPDIRDAWDRLHAAVPNATAFHTHAWQQAVFQTRHAQGHLRLLTVWDADAQLVAVLHFCIRDDGVLDVAGSSVSDYLDPLIHPEFERQAWSLLLRMLARMCQSDDRRALLHCVRDSASCRALLPVLAPIHGFAYEERVVAQTPFLALPKSWDDYLALLEPHERKETRRKLNKVQTKANARLSRCSSEPADIKATLAQALALMEQAPGEKGETVRKTLRPLLERAAPALIASGHLWLTTLYLEDQPAAVALQFPCRAGPQLYNCGFDAAKKEWSPGIVLNATLIQQAIESGAAEFDLLRGEEPYKYRLGARNRPLWKITLHRT